VGGETQAPDLSGLTAGRTKIVATVGPASSTPEMLRRLIEAGVSVFRLNFSHGTHEAHSAVVSEVRAASRELGRHVGVLQDLCGPKMRLGSIPGDVIDCALGDEFTLVSQRRGAAGELTCSYANLPDDLEIGETVLFADGTVAMEVVGREPGRARLRVTLAGRLRSRQGLNLPGSDLAVESLTDKDLRDLDWTARHGGEVDFVGLSFARTAQDVERLRRELQTRQCRARIVVKIEKPQAVAHLEDIVAATDAVMVARGDLGVEMDVHRVPAIQKRVIALCNAAHRPVITATQMLNSMEHSSRPTRAEASDVFNAVLDGTDAVMLSGESAVGEYPVEAVATMRRICTEAERFLKTDWSPADDDAASLASLIDPITEAGVDAASLAVRQLDAALIVVAADSGRSALALSNRRPAAPVLAHTRTEETARLLTLCWGVVPVLLPAAIGADGVLAHGLELAQSRGLVRDGDHAVLLRGRAMNRANTVAVVVAQVRAS
jgi:pyruvate kinase